MTDSKDERVMTVAEVVELFRDTIFWNCLDPWPCREKEPEYPLTVLDDTPDDPDEPRVATLRFESGELTITVATMHPIRAHQDAEAGVTDYDVEFLEKLPVIIPTLLAEIDRQKALTADLLSAARRVRDYVCIPSIDYRQKYSDRMQGPGEMERIAAKLADAIAKAETEPPVYPPPQGEPNAIEPGDEGEHDIENDPGRDR